MCVCVCVSVCACVCLCLCRCLCLCVWLPIFGRCAAVSIAASPKNIATIGAVHTVCSCARASFACVRVHAPHAAHVTGNRVRETIHCRNAGYCEQLQVRERIRACAACPAVLLPWRPAVPTGVTDRMRAAACMRRCGSASDHRHRGSRRRSQTPSQFSSVRLCGRMHVRPLGRVHAGEAQSGALQIVPAYFNMESGMVTRS